MSSFNKKRFLFYTIGLIILSLGIALTIWSELGASPFDATLVGLYSTFGLTIGSWEIVLGLSFVLVNTLASRSRPEWFALMTSLITGAGIDTWMFLLSDLLHPTSLWGQSFCLALGMLCMGLGVAVNLKADFAPNPMDRTMMILRKLTGFNVAVSRSLISIVLVMIAFIFNGPIGIGTLLNAVFLGYIIQFMMPIVDRVAVTKSKQPKRLTT